MPWKPDGILKAIMAWTTVTMTVIWTPFIRCLMDGTTYEWNTTWLGFTFCAQGVGGDYWLISMVTFFGVALLYLGWRGARQPFHLLLLLWQIAFAGDYLYLALRSSEQSLVLHQGVDTRLVWLLAAVAGAFVLLSLFWVIRDLGRFESRKPPPWNNRNSFLLGASLALLPVLFLLFHFGRPQSAAQTFGLALAIIQWIVLSLAFVPWKLPAGSGYLTRA